MKIRIKAKDSTHSSFDPNKVGKDKWGLGLIEVLEEIRDLKLSESETKELVFLYWNKLTDGSQFNIVNLITKEESRDMSVNEKLELMWEAFEKTKKAGFISFTSNRRSYMLLRSTDTTFTSEDNLLRILRQQFSYLRTVLVRDYAELKQLEYLIENNELTSLSYGVYK